MSWANTEAIGKFGDRPFIQESFLDKTHTARHCRCSSAPRRASRCRLGSAAKAWPETCPLSTHVCRSPGTISGPRSVLPEPDPNSKPPLSGRLPTSPAARGTGISPGRDIYRPSARCCRVRRVSADRAARPSPHTRGKPRLLDLGRRIPARDRFAPDSPLEEAVWSGRLSAVLPDRRAR